MKKNFILLAGLALFATGSAFASSEPVIELPAVVVTAPRYTEAERAINASLSELRESAKPAPQAMTPPLRQLATLAPKPPAPIAKAGLAFVVAVKA
ncbi:MAG TPA: hypothetical protein VEB66_01800 [Opitutaceae bacterium]|nr:hypothetical protein [Opitutaceae bacterium]